MRKLLIVLSVLFIVVSIVFVIVPMGTLGILPVGIALVFAIAALIISETEQKKFPKWLVIVSGLLIVIVLAKAAIPDEVKNDATFEQKKTESKNEDLKDLEDLENDLE